MQLNLKGEFKMDIRLAQMRDLAVELKPLVRDAIEDSERAKAMICRIDLCILTCREARVILYHLEKISDNPIKEKDSSFISPKLIRCSGNSNWEKLQGLIEVGKR